MKDNDDEELIRNLMGIDKRLKTTRDLKGIAECFKWAYLHRRKLNGIQKLIIQYFRMGYFN